MNLRSLLKRYLPERHKIQDHKHLQHFGDLLHDPNLWHLTRRSTAGGVAIGLFCAFIPIPIQMIIAAGAAILLGVNLPLAVIFAWISNPVTITPLFFFAYEIGSWILDKPVHLTTFEFSFQWAADNLGRIWQPLLLGCFIMGSFSAAIGYTAVRLLWRLSLVHKWEVRRVSRQNRTRRQDDKKTKRN